MREDRLDLRGKEELRAVTVIVQRLDPVPIPGKEEPLPRAIPDRKGEVSVEAIEAGFAPLLIRVDNDLRVRPGAKVVPGPFQFSAQLLKVVQLTVVDEDDRTDLIAHRLVSGRGEVDDSEAAVPQTNRTFHVVIFVIQSTMAQNVDHALEQAGRNRLAVQMIDADNTAHWDTY